MKVLVSKDVFQKQGNGSSCFTITKAMIESTLPNAGVQFKIKRDVKLLPFRVYLHGNGGVAERDSIDGFVGNKIGELPTATRGTWFFDGWYDSPDSGLLITQDSKVSSSIANLYAHWIQASTVNFDPNGGSLRGQTSILVWEGRKLGESGVAFPTATGPSDNPNFVGWYTSSVGGTRLTQDTIYDGSYTTIYPHYANQSYQVELNGQWFKDDRSGIDPNGNSYGTSYSTNPDPNEYDGTYISYSNFNADDEWSKMRINFVGYSEFVVYIRSYAESYYDYTVIGELDENITSNPEDGYESTNGEQNSGTAISNYKKVIYSNLDGGQHFIDIVYRKDVSVSSNQDRGYVLIPNTRQSVPITITFETNGGSQISPIQMMSGNKITKPTDPAKTDWYFGGWYSDSTLTQSWNFNTLVYENITLYAKWNDSEQELPPGYVECNYIEKYVNGQYIDTGLVIGDKYQCKMKLQYPQSTPNDTWMVGTWNTSPQTSDYLIGCFNGLRAQCGVDSSINYSTSITNDRQPHIFGIMKDKFIVDDIEQTTYPDFTKLPSSAMSQNLLLFKSHHTDNSTPRRLYWCKIYDMNDNLVRNFVPCLDTNQEPCLYDFVENKTYYPNTGTLRYEI